ENINKIYETLHAYGVAQRIVIDLSLINHMDYYSDMIFQGFIDNIGKPVIMGGRYDTLANQFGANIPASGFACDVDTLAENIVPDLGNPIPEIDFLLLYEKPVTKKAFQLVKQLRHDGYQVITYPNYIQQEKTPKTAHTITMTEKELRLTTKEQSSESFSSIEAFWAYIKRGESNW